MKNSLFKRVVAAASAVPLALTQCLTVANAVSVDDAATSLNDQAVTAATAKDVTIDVLLNIVPDETDGVKYEELTGDEAIISGETADELIAKYASDREGAKVFTKASEWNLTAYSYIQQAIKSGKNTGKVDISDLVNYVVKNSGKHKEIVERAFGFLSDVTYELQSNGDVVFKASLSQPVFYGTVDQSVGKILYNYGVYPVDFSSVDVTGEFVLTVGTSALSSDTEVPVKFVFNSNAKGAVYAAGLPDFALDTVTKIKTLALDAIAASDISSSDKEKASAEVAETSDWYIKKINAAKNEYAHDMQINREGEFENVAGLIAEINQAIKNRGYKKQIPATATDILTSATGSKAYTKALEQINKAAGSYTVKISAAELGAAVDSIYDLYASLRNGVAEAKGKYNDAEAADVADFFKTFALPEEYEVLADFKAGTAKVDGTGAATETAAVLSGDFQRVVVVAPVTTTSTTTVTTTTETTTTTTAAETTTTAAETTTTAEPAQTTTTAEATTTAAAETTTTAAAETTTTAAAETTTTAQPAETTTTVETTTAVDTTTAVTTVATTTSTVTGTDPSGRKYSGETVTGIDVAADSEVGFYLNIDTEFNREQIKSVSYSEGKHLVFKYEDGDKEEVPFEKLTDADKALKAAVEAQNTPVELNLDDIDFGDQKPENSYTPGSSIFAHQITLYAKNDIDAIGVKAGEPLTTIAGANVSVTAYIGVKGDADLDHIADATDASAVLVYYSAMMTGGKPEETQFSNSPLVEAPGDMLDEFAAFLCDVDAEFTPEDRVADNWKNRKPKRFIDSSDASYILACYSSVMTGSEPNRATWNEVLDLD